MKCYRWIIVVMLFGMASLVSAHTIEGKVVSVIDGDTIKILTEQKQQHKIRLWGIDAPESKQAWGHQATLALRKRIQNKWVQADIITKDRYQRDVAVIFYKNKDINEWMVRNGYAWVYRQYNKDRYYGAERLARKQQRGLWKLPKAEQTPPWVFRRQ